MVVEPESLKLAPDLLNGVTNPSLLSAAGEAPYAKMLSGHAKAATIAVPKSAPKTKFFLVKILFNFSPFL
jgi:hypothetical protein